MKLIEKYNIRVVKVGFPLQVVITDHVTDHVITDSNNFFFFFPCSDTVVSESPPNGKRPSLSPTKPSEFGEGNTSQPAHCFVKISHFNLLFSLYLHRICGHVHLREHRTG